MTSYTSPVLLSHNDHTILYHVYLYIEPDGELVLSESCHWWARKKRKSDYDDHLFIPPAYFDAVLAQLRLQFPRFTVPAEETEKENVLCQLFQKFYLKNKKAALLSQHEEGYRLLRSWLDRAAIPYELVQTLWSGYSDYNVTWDGHQFVEVEKSTKAQGGSGEKILEAKSILLRERSDPGRSHWLFVTTGEDGTLTFYESYEYSGQGDDDGMEYEYYLTVPAGHVDAVLALLIQLNGSEHPVIPDQGKDAILVELLQQLMKQGRGISEQVTYTTTLQRWFNKGAIPYTLTNW